MENKKKILLVDDEEDFCFFLKKNLEETGEYEVFTANKEQKGLELAREVKPDLILLDIIMPELSGGEMAEALSSDFQTSKIPIVFLTAVVTREEAGVGPIKRIGGQRFIAKTTGPERIMSSIKEILK